eukprot:356298-Chlamydomonas_euryale.AAC.12
MAEGRRGGGAGWRPGEGIGVLPALRCTEYTERPAIRRERAGGKDWRAPWAVQHPRVLQSGGGAGVKDWGASWAVQHPSVLQSGGSGRERGGRV